MMEAKFLSRLVTDNILGSRYVRLEYPFSYYSKILDQIINIPAGFICDFESVPMFKASSKRGGTIHDYFCRVDSCPVVTKQQAASLYLEAQKCKDIAMDEPWWKRWDRAIRRNFKTLVVRVAPGYFHKLKVLATLEEVSKA